MDHRKNQVLKRRGGIEVGWGGRERNNSTESQGLGDSNTQKQRLCALGQSLPLPTYVTSAGYLQVKLLTHTLWGCGEGSP